MSTAITGVCNLTFLYTKAVCGPSLAPLHLYSWLLSHYTNPLDMMKLFFLLILLLVHVLKSQNHGIQVSRISRVRVHTVAIIFFMNVLCYL